MRWIVILLLVLNVVYFGWEFDRQIEIDIKNNTAFINIPDKSNRITMLSEQDVPPKLLEPMKQSASVSSEKQPQQGFDVIEESEDQQESIPVPFEQLVTELPEIDIPGLHPDTKQSSCFTFGPLAEEILAVGLSDWFNSRRATTNRRNTIENGKQLFWIYLSPQESRSGAMDIIRELRKKGVSDYRLISDGNLQNAISLGLFSSQASVNSRLNELEKKGYKPVVVPYYNEKTVYWVDVQFQADSSFIEQVFKGYPSRFNYVPVDCGKIALMMSRL